MTATTAIHHSIPTLPKTVTLSNGVMLDLHTKKGLFLGIGKVRAPAPGSGTLLRSGKRPMTAQVRSPDAVEMFDFVVKRQHVGPEQVTLELGMKQRQAGVMDWMVHTVRNRQAITDWTPGKAPETSDATLVLEIKPVSRRIGATDYAGFSYQYRYRSASVPIYKILDLATWEIGGKAVGNELWMRNCFVPSVVKIDSVEQFHSTEWYLPSCENPSIFQFLPLQTELQGFSFAASNKGTLVTWATKVAHVRSLFEKPRGQDVIVHAHEHAGNLASEFETSPVEVLYAPSAGKQDFVARANRWEEVRELVHETLHRELDMRRERVTTYGQIEEWDPADMERYRTLGLPKLLALGMKMIGLANHFQTNMNVWGISNMCCTVDYHVAESVGEDKLTAFCRDAKAGGAAVEMWGNTSISTMTVLLDNRGGVEGNIKYLPKEGSIMEALKKTKTGFVRNPSNAIEADHYTPQFAVLNLRDPVVRDYWLARWGYASSRIGLGGIFLDSSFNLSSDKFHFIQNTATEASSSATADQTHLLGHYRPAKEHKAAILSQYRAHLTLMKEMQDRGYVYCNEDLGVFGIHRHGPAIDARMGSLPLWSDCICSFEVPAIKAAGGDPDEVFFRGLAYRMMWVVCWDIKKDRLSFHYYGWRGDHDTPSEFHAGTLRTFNEVHGLMLERTILPKQTGVVYRAGGKRVLWAFENLKFDAGAQVEVRDITEGRTNQVTSLAAKKHHVYVIG